VHPIYDAGEAESFLFDFGRKTKLKRIDLALPDLFFSEEEIVVWNSILEELKKEIHSVFIGFNELLWFGF
jgi:release factor glutamine methyltransferase